MVNGPEMENITCYLNKHSAEMEIVQYMFWMEVGAALRMTLQLLGHSIDIRALSCLGIWLL